MLGDSNSGGEWVASTREEPFESRSANAKNVESDEDDIEQRQDTAFFVEGSSPHRSSQAVFVAKKASRTV
jgi:hypothetical protein